MDPALGGEQTFGQRTLDRRAGGFRAARALEPEQAAHQRAERVPPGAGAEVEHQAEVEGEALVLGLPSELLDQRGLADPGLAAEVDALAGAALPTGAQHALELGELGAPADERAAVRAPALAEPGEPPGEHRSREPLDLQRAGLGTAEAGRQLAAHRVRDQDLAAACAIGEARGEVHRIAGHGVFAVGVAAGPARHHLTARDPDVDVDLAADLLAERRHRVADRERGAGRPLGVVAVRDRRAEHRHHAVADVLVDPAAEGRDEAVGAREETAEQAVHLLGVELARKRGEAHQVDEQHAHLAPLAPGRAGGRLRRVRRARLQGGAAGGTELVPGLRRRAAAWTARRQPLAALGAEPRSFGALEAAARAAHGPASSALDGCGYRTVAAPCRSSDGSAETAKGAGGNAADPCVPRPSGGPLRRARAGPRRSGPGRRA